MLHLLSALTFLGLSYGQGFSSGNDFSVNTLKGSVHVQCREYMDGGRTSYDFANFYCERETLSPTEMDYFVLPQGVSADKVKLSSFDKSGKKIDSVTKTYSDTKGRTANQVNLWIDTLLQDPMLTEGTNVIHYAYSKRGGVSGEGEFTVEVTRGPDVECDRGYLDSSSLNECRSSYSACERYFRQQDYCGLGK